MQDDNLYKELREQSWRRKLSPAEEAQVRVWLEAHPEARADLEVEAGLNDALERLKEPEVPSNFTARVLAAVEADAAREERAGADGGRQGWRFWNWRWLPKVALASVVLVAGLLGLQYHQHEQHEKRVQYARSVATITDVASLPSPAILQDFDAIHAMNQVIVPDEAMNPVVVPVPDEELLKAFQ
jgi:anti-sigma factor RsiW